MMDARNKSQALYTNKINPQQSIADNYTPIKNKFDKSRLNSNASPAEKALLRDNPNVTLVSEIGRYIK